MRHLLVHGPRNRTWTFEVPTRRRERVRGLRDRTELAPDHAMFFERCRSVHTVGMRFAITVASIDREGRVIHVGRMRPRRLMVPRPGVRSVLECHVDADVRAGDRFEVVRDLSAAGGKPPAALRPSRR
jgi:uncharacterized membrane protein (UPF0127 family)